MAMPVGDWTLTALLSPSVLWREFKQYGLFISDSNSGAGRIVVWANNYSGTEPSNGLVIQQWNTVNSFNNNSFQGGGGFSAIPMWFRLSNVGGTVTYSFSLDGENFTDGATQSLTAWCTAPTTIGIMLNTNNNAATYVGTESLICMSLDL
jgi:hypothetical protein